MSRQKLVNMAEEPVFFFADDLRIAGLRFIAPGNKGVVITHPHSLYGGSMDNAVVETLVRVYQRAGYSTLRFNFRGVGESQGSYDAGRGEQEFAPPDLIASALSHWNPEASLQIIQGADHFYGGCTDALASVLAASLPEV